MSVPEESKDKLETKCCDCGCWDPDECECDNYCNCGIECTCGENCSSYSACINGESLKRKKERYSKTDYIKCHCFKLHFEEITHDGCCSCPGDHNLKEYTKKVYVPVDIIRGDPKDLEKRYTEMHENCLSAWNCYAYMSTLVEYTKIKEVKCKKNRQLMFLKRSNDNHITFESVWGEVTYDLGNYWGEKYRDEKKHLYNAFSKK